MSSLTNLIDYCWSVGLPVLHISAFPPGAKKMERSVSVRNGHCAVSAQEHQAFRLAVIHPDPRTRTHRSRARQQGRRAGR